MKSRYNYMVASSQIDVDGEAWPDVLSLNYNAFEASEVIKPLELTESDVKKFWYSIYKFYGKAEWDDIVMSLNGIAHSNFLAVGSVLYLPTINDMETSFKKKSYGS